MKEQAATESSRQERQLVALLRKLPPERSAQVFAFARFVAYETFKTDELELLNLDEVLDDAETENDAQWEAIGDTRRIRTYHQIHVIASRFFSATSSIQ